MKAKELSLKTLEEQGYTRTEKTAEIKGKVYALWSHPDPKRNDLWLDVETKGFNLKEIEKFARLVFYPKE